MTREMERHLTFLLSGLAGLLTLVLVGISSWTLGQTIRHGNTLARIEQEIKTATDDRYRAADARADFSARDERIKDHARRLDKHDARITNLERGEWPSNPR